jgi:hypothetical protein
MAGTDQGKYGLLSDGLKALQNSDEKIDLMMARRYEKSLSYSSTGRPPNQ